MINIDIVVDKRVAYLIIEALERQLSHCEGITLRFELEMALLSIKEQVKNEKCGNCHYLSK